MTTTPVMLITGASSGIGEATARLFSRNGYRVVLAARRQERLQALAQEIETAGGEALAVPTDVTRLEDLRGLLQSVLEHYQQIDILLNNAGFGRLDWLENLDPVTDIEAQLKVNVLGMVQVARAVLPHMIARRSGHIINMASVAGFVATPTYTIYAASKFAVRGFTEALRREAGVWGIHVSAIYPGGVETEFSTHTGAKRKTGVSTPRGLRLKPEQVASAVLSVARRPRPTVVLPGVMRFAAWANILFPGLVDWIIEQRFVKPERGI